MATPSGPSHIPYGVITRALAALPRVAEPARHVGQRPAPLLVIEERRIHQPDEPWPIHRGHLLSTAGFPTARAGTDPGEGRRCTPAYARGSAGHATFRMPTIVVIVLSLVEVRSVGIVRRRTLSTSTLMFAKSAGAVAANFSISGP